MFCFCKLKEQRRSGKNFEKIKANKIKTDNTMEEGRREGTPPSLGFWPKLVALTVPRSLLLWGNGKSKGRMSPPVRTPKSSGPPMRKVPRPKQKKTPHHAR